MISCQSSSHLSHTVIVKERQLRDLTIACCSLFEISNHRGSITNLEVKMLSDNYNEHLFRGRVSDCLEQTRKILRNEKQLTTLDKVAHKYADKYHIVDYLGRAAIVCYLNCFSTLGLYAEDLAKLVSWLEVIVHGAIFYTCIKGISFSVLKSISLIIVCSNKGCNRLSGYY